MSSKNSALAAATWRFAPLVISFVWLIDYIFRVFASDAASFQRMIITPERFYIPIILIGIMFFFTITFPYQFYVHGAFCWIFGLLKLIDGGLANALLVHLLGYVFLYRQGFFRTNKRIKLIIGGLIIAAAIASQARFEDVYILTRVIHFVCSAVIIAIAGIILKPEIYIIRKKKQEMILALPSDLFTEKDAAILRKIQAGQKYESIANEENQALSTFKKYIRRLFNILIVSDRTSFLSLYANHQIIIERRYTSKEKEDIENTL